MKTSSQVKVLGGLPQVPPDCVPCRGIEGREIGGVRGTGYVDIHGGIHGNGCLQGLEATAAQVGGIHQGRASRIQLGYEGVEASAPDLEGIQSRKGGRNLTSRVNPKLVRLVGLCLPRPAVGDCKAAVILRR
jgi:hypothetical protein